MGWHWLCGGSWPGHLVQRDPCDAQPKRKTYECPQRRLRGEGGGRPGNGRPRHKVGGVTPPAAESSVPAGGRKERSSLLSDLLCCSLLAAVSAVCYVNSLEGDFVHDDVVAVTTNPDVLGKTSLEELFANDFWGKPMADPSSHKSYRPLTVMTFRFNVAVGGMSAHGFHLVNILMHTAVVLLLMQVCRDVLLWRREAVMTAALLFASHPIHTEAVSSIVGRADVLCCLMYLSSLLAYARSTSHALAPWQAAGWLTLSLFTAGLALLSKEQGVTVLAVSLGYQYSLAWDTKKKKKYLEGSPKRRWDSRIVILLSTLVVLLVFRVWMLHGNLPRFSEQDNPAAFSPVLMTRVLTYAYLAAFNAWLLMFPLLLSYDWQMGSIPLVQSLWDPRNLTTLYLLVVTASFIWQVAFGVKDIERRRLILVFCLLVIPFLPASNLLVTVGFVVAERVLYIPSVGFCLVVTHGVQRLGQRGPVVAWLCRISTCLLLALFVLRTVTRNAVWVSRETLFKSGLDSVPKNAKVYYNYANYLKDKGDVDLAVKHYRTALSLWPDHASAHNNLGTLLNESEEAERHFKIALAINPQHPKAHFNLANLYSKQSKLEIAMKLLDRATELDPTFVAAYSSLASLHAERGEMEEAEQLHLLALALEPDNADCHNNYGAFLQKAGRTQEAVSQYQQALAIQPQHTVALVNAAKTLRSQRHTGEAESLYNRALAVQEDPQIMDNLGVLYLTTGRQEHAKKLYEKLHQKYPEHQDGTVNFAQLLLQDRSFTRAEELLLSVVQKNSRHREALHLLATLYSHTNRTAEALHYIGKALTLCSADDTSCASLRAEHGDILKDFNDFDSAEQSYHLALMLDPTLAHAHLNLAVIHHLRGHYGMAEKHYHAAYVLDSDHKLLLDNMEKLKKTAVPALGNRCPRGAEKCRLR